MSNITYTIVVEVHTSSGVVSGYTGFKTSTREEMLELIQAVEHSLFRGDYISLQTSPDDDSNRLILRKGILDNNPIFILCREI